MNILLFAGTTEGRLLAEGMAELPVRADICVATEYGGEILEGLPDRFRIHVGRMDAGAMRSFMIAGGYDHVVDATHPYAVEASKNIEASSASAGIPYVRLARRGSSVETCLYVDSAAEAARTLATMTGNVLLATGSKDLAAYTAVPEYAERMYPRVLPTVGALRECESLGYRRSHIIAMQGPFSRELNLALIRQLDIAALVTKDGGAEGGFPEKMRAAEDAGITALVIGRPREAVGDDLVAVLARVRSELEAEG